MLKKQILLFFFSISIIPFCHATSSTPKELLNQFMTTQQLNQFKNIQTKKFKNLLKTVPPEELINLNKYIIHALRFHFLILGRELYSCLRLQDTDFFFLSLKATLNKLKHLEVALVSTASKKFIIKFDKYLLKCSGFSHRDQVKLFYLRTYCNSLLSTFYKQLHVCEKMFFEDTVLPKEVIEQKYKPLSTFWLLLQYAYQDVFQYTILTSADKLVFDSETITSCSEEFNLVKIKKDFKSLTSFERFKDRFETIEGTLSEQQKTSYKAELENLQRITQKINKINSSELNGKTVKNFTSDFYTSLSRFFDHAHLYFALYSSSFNALQEAIQTSSNNNIPQKEKMAIALQCDSYNDLCTISDLLVTGSASKEFFNISPSLENNIKQEVTLIQNSSNFPSKNLPQKLTILRHSRAEILNKIKNINEGFYKFFVKILPWAGDDEVQYSIYPLSWFNNPNNNNWLKCIDPILPLFDMLITRNRMIEENQANRTADKNANELLKNTQKKISQPLHSIASEELGLPNKKHHQAIRGFINIVLKTPTDTNKQKLETIITTIARSNYLLMQPLPINQKLVDKTLPNNLAYDYIKWVLKEIQRSKGTNWINNDDASRFFQKLFHAYPSLFVTLPQKKLSEQLCYALGIPYNTSDQTTLTFCPSKFVLTNELFPASQKVPQNKIRSGVFTALLNQTVDNGNPIPPLVEFNETLSPHYPLEALIDKKQKKLISEQFIEKTLIDSWLEQLPTFTPDDLKTITYEALESLRLSLFVPAYKQLLLESKNVKETLPIVHEFNKLFHQMITKREKQKPLSPKAAQYIDLYKKECFKDSTIHPDTFINYLDFTEKCNQNLKTFYGLLKQLDNELFKTTSQHTFYTLKDSEKKLVNGADILGKLFLELYKYPYLFETNQLNTLNHSILSTSLKSNNPPPLLFFETRLFNRFIEIKKHLKKTGALTAYSTLTNDGLIDKQVSLKELQERVTATLVTRREKIVALLNMQNAYQQNIDAMPHDFILNSPRYFTYYKALLSSLFTQCINVPEKLQIAQALRFFSLRDILLIRNKKHTPLIEKIFSEAYFLYGNINDSDTNILSENESSMKKELLKPLINLYQNQHITKQSFPNPEILNFSDTVSKLNEHYKVIMTPQ
ncbi:MAG: hypothetical protein UV38_C0001G0292 [candidate division TM6 bacterium GW2011_GWE2_42_60]|nr:MAG: hypothetical protein UV38_C0001G0292 [candidate division TM6 bacterium GW2011_GWE2_42_60]HBY05515.1 hypothetical protein [Candidatus Dependentiae bacterium]